MELKFVEAGNGFNWGKFWLGRFTDREWNYQARYPGANAQRLLTSQGWSPANHIWVGDLATGEAALFAPGGFASADLDKHRIWVCPLFEPFLTWLYAYRKENPSDWWDSLPAVVELPEAPAALHGYRRGGRVIRFPEPEPPTPS